MLENNTCSILCHSTITASATEGQGDAGFINDRILDGYSLNWLIDGLPAARVRMDSESRDTFYSVGFELGSFDSSGVPLLNNHYDIIVEYHVPRLPCLGRDLVLCAGGYGDRFIGASN